MCRRLLVVMAAIAMTACGTFGIELFPRQPPGPDQEVVESLVCGGREALADTYLEDRGADRADRIERIERARMKCALFDAPDASS